MTQYSETHKPVAGFISPFDTDDKKASSGTPYYIARSFEKMGYKVKWIPVKKNRAYIIAEKIFIRLNKVINKLTGKRIYFDFTYIAAYLLSLSVDRSATKECALLVVPFCAPVIKYLRTDKKLIYFTDATFASMVNYYPDFTGLTDLSIRQGRDIEREAIKRSTKVIYGCDWARNSAINDLNQNPDKLHVVEYGGNINDQDIHKFRRSDNKNTEVLFLGVDWERKGGKIALDICSDLISRGINVSLNIVGIKESDINFKLPEFATCHGFLNKNNPRDYQLLNEIIGKCNLLLLPTQAECTGIAFSESSAYGLPSFTFDTGGISNYIVDGVNGYLFKPGTSPEAIGKKISETIASGELQEMSVKARELYENKLNWNVWSQRVESIIQNM